MAPLGSKLTGAGSRHTRSSSGVTAGAAGTVSVGVARLVRVGVVPRAVGGGDVVDGDERDDGSAEHAMRASVATAISRSERRRITPVNHACEAVAMRHSLVASALASLRASRSDETALV
jgi:hypothetical protein